MASWEAFRFDGGKPSGFAGMRMAPAEVKKEATTLQHPASFKLLCFSFSHRPRAPLSSTLTAVPRGWKVVDRVEVRDLYHPHVANNGLT